MKKTLFLSPPSFDGFDGGAGARYQAKREITSYWFPTWLAQPAAMVAGSKLMDAAPHHQTMADVLAIANDYELFILHTSTPSLKNDVACAEAIKAKNPHAQIGLIGAHVAILPTETMNASPVIDFVCRNEFDYTCVEVAENKPWANIKGLTWRDANCRIQHNPERELIHDWDAMPSVLPVYHRDLQIEKYFIGYLQHPYVSFYTGRGCPAKCSFCLWPQTIGGHAYRTKSPAAVIREMEVGKELFGNRVREWMFDDDTFTIDKARAIEIAKGMKKLKLTWSCNARAQLDYETLKQLRDNGLRLLLVGFESGNQEILNRMKKGIRLETARQFMRNCRKLGIRVHGTFIIGLPIETQETIEETIRFAEEIDPFSIQVSIAAPYPGTELFKQATANGWIDAGALQLSGNGIQVSTLRYEHLSTDEIEDAVERMYRRFYFRHRPILRFLREMATDRQMLVRRLREGGEFFDYLRERKQIVRSRQEQVQAGAMLRLRAFGLFILAPLCSLSAFGGPDSFRFRLHKFEQPIGFESDSVSRQGRTLQTESAFEFTDRGRKVPLKATLRCSTSYIPSFFAISGSTSRSSSVDTTIRVKGHTAKVSDGKSLREVTVPRRFFTIAGYAPACLQEALVRYWQRNGRPAQFALLPSGTVEIEDRGRDTFSVGSARVPFRRYSVRGLVWGLETLWMDDKDRLAAVVTRDAEFDLFEAVREVYEPALADFVSAGARDEIANLAEIDKSLPGRRTGALAITGATLIDGLGGDPVSPATIVTRKGRIVAAGPAAAITIPDDAERMDATGKYIIPGLWDMHAHYEQVEWGPIYLAAGVTTVRDVGNEFGFITAIRDANNAGLGLGPRLLLAGIVDGDGPTALGVQRVNSATDAAAWVKKYHDAGFQQMKIYSSVKPDVVKAVCEDAHAMGMTVTGHIPHGMSILDGIAAGMDQVNHISYVTAAFLPEGFEMDKATPAERTNAVKSIDPNSATGRRVIAVLKEHGTVIDDTASLYELGTKTAGEPGTTVEPGIANVAPELQRQFRSGGATGDALSLAKLRWSKTLEIMGVLHRAGIRFVAGTDQGVPGYSIYREIEIYVEAGFTPMEALQAATIVPPQVMKVDSDSGTVEAGKRADFDILDANPLDDIHNIRSVRRVVANGILYDPRTVVALGRF